MLNKVKSFTAVFSTIRTVLPLLLLAVEIFSFVHDKLSDYASKNIKGEEIPLGV